jgi:hypothetical protein
MAGTSTSPLMYRTQNHPDSAPYKVKVVPVLNSLSITPPSPKTAELFRKCRDIKEEYYLF